MRQLNIFILLAMITFSCVDEFDSGIKPEKPESIVQNEEINSYDVLKAYIDTNSTQSLKLGAYVNSASFLEKSHIYSLIESNFNQIAAPDFMSHGAVVNEDGSMNFSTVENFLELAKENNLDVFGFPLIWHLNQNGTFLNGRYGPKEFETPSFPNLLDKAGLVDGSFAGWESIVSGGSIQIADYNGDDVVKLTSGPNSSNPEDLRLTSPQIEISESTYELTVFILSDKEGEGRIAFEGLSNNTPELDWTGNGVKSSTFKTFVGWSKISFQISEFAAENIRVHIDLGYKPNVNYYVHVEGLSVCDINSEFENPDEIFLEAENGAVGSKWTIEEDEDASGGQYTVVLSADALLEPGDDPSNNVSHTFTINTPGKYKFWLRGTGASANDDSFHLKVDDNDWITWNNALSNIYDWHIIDTLDFSAGTHEVTVSYREDGAKLDRLYFTLTDKAPTGMGSPVALTKKLLLDILPEDKKQAVNATLEEWMSSLITAVNDDVTAWNVVNEPMDDNMPYELKTGNGSMDENVFYWQDYLGKDYAVQAFKVARSNVDEGDLLFIGDYGLVNNLEKCRGLIEYVNYIEDNGGTVDGIAVQMHLSLGVDENKISSMFEMLAETGKLVKVAQLEVSIPGSVEVTAETLQSQAQLYNSVVSKYYQHVPAAQCYGIELVGLVDSGDGANGLWDANYNRKPAYAGFARGMQDQ